VSLFDLIVMVSPIKGGHETPAARCVRGGNSCVAIGDGIVNSVRCLAVAGISLATRCAAARRGLIPSPILADIGAECECCYFCVIDATVLSNAKRIRVGVNIFAV